jgi:DNA primase
MLEVLDSASPLADVLWGREIEAGSLATPERRAALETRIGDIVRSIGDEAVRKYYRQDFEGRLRALFAPSFAQRGYTRERALPPTGRRERARGAAFAGASPALAPLSPRLTTSPIVRGFRSALPPREAVILVAVLNHPWLLEHHAEEFAALEFLHPDADALRRSVLDIGTGESILDGPTLRAVLAGRGLDGVLRRLETALTHDSDWPAREGAAEEDVAQWWVHVITLHRKQRTLNKELKDAERALGEEPSEANLAWIRDIQGRLSALEGMEALIEGFGTSSGRPVRSI